VNKRTVIVVDQAPIHTNDYRHDQLEEWGQREIEIFSLPSYSPQLNLIEILWRFIKYEWIPLSAYQSSINLVDYVEKVLREFGENYNAGYADRDDKCLVGTTGIALDSRPVDESSRVCVTVYRLSLQ